MTTILDSAQRQLFAELANVILPGGSGQPAARDIDIANQPLDSTLRSRPDLEPVLIARLQNYYKAKSVGAEEYILSLEEAELRQLMLIVCATYYMNPIVKQSIGYNGQQAIPLGRGGFGAEELVMEMMEKPKIFRRAND
ncbi:MAG: hypothetical protein ACI8P9_005635 [Parasphingorhabdus sp.]|jgi:hypothetical protein